jgi:hypothetical protein
VDENIRAAAQTDLDSNNYRGSSMASRKEMSEDRPLFMGNWGYLAG